MSSGPRVTVAMPLYNHGAHVGAAVDSILAQTFTDFELLVIDDGSTDDGPAAVQCRRDARIRLLHNPGNLGLAKTRNRLLEEARGVYIANLDSDDVARSDRLAKQVAFLDANPDVAVVGSWCAFIAEDGSPVRGAKRHALRAEDIHAEMLFRCPLSNRAVMGRAGLLRQYGYREAFIVQEDVDLLSRIADRHRLANLPETLVFGRRHPAQTTRRTEPHRMVLYERIAVDRLRGLGIQPTPTEAERHARIGRSAPGLRHDAAFVAWTEAWLQRLQRANETAAVYDPRALRRAVGAAWARTCWLARRALTPRQLARIAASPLTRAALAAAGHHSGELVRARFGRAQAG